MQIYIKVKQLGKRKAILERECVEIEDLPQPCTLKDLIAGLVRQQVAAYCQKAIEKPILPFLTSEQIQEKAIVGKVGFDTRYHDKQPVLKDALENAFIAFQDGIYVVFADEQPLPTLETILHITPETTFLFLRLSLLYTF
jgi:hypothetical protein